MPENQETQVLALDSEGLPRYVGRAGDIAAALLVASADYSSLVPTKDQPVATYELHQQPVKTARWTCIHAIDPATHPAFKPEPPRYDALLQEGEMVMVLSDGTEIARRDEDECIIVTFSPYMAFRDELLTISRRVVDSWDSGDLATNVRSLSEALANIEG